MPNNIIDVKAKTIQNYYRANALSDQFFIFDSHAEDSDPFNQVVVTDFPVRVDILMAIVCKEGTLKINVGYGSYVIRENDFINIFPHSVFQVTEISSDFKAKIICIEPDFFDFNNERHDFDVLSILKEYPCRSLPSAKMEIVSTLLDYIKDIILEKDNVYRKEIIFYVLKIMSREVSNLVLTQNKNQQKTALSPGDQVINKFLKAIEVNFQKERSVTYYADKAFLTPKYFSAVIFRLTGKRAKDWIDEYTVMAAKAMLKSSYQTIQQISYELNFATPSHFGRYFKHHTGISPLQYRNS